MEKFVKITEEMVEKCEVRENLCDKVELMYTGSQIDHHYCLDEALLDCESPIEQLLAIEFYSLGLLQVGLFNPFVDVVTIEKQYKVKCREKTYRVDFAILVLYKNQGEKWFVIECDGHEFHQKTKEQVERDNVRTRDLQTEGFEVIRFSGTEIWNRPYLCAREVLRVILSKCKYTKED